IKSVGARVRFDSDLADGRQIDGARQFGDVLRFRIGRRERSDSDSILLRKHDPVHQDVFVAAPIYVFEIVTALRTQLTFNIDTVVSLDFRPELGWNQVQWLFVHRAILDCVHCAVSGSAPPLETTLEHRHDCGFASAYRAHQKENPLADLQPLAGRLEVLDHSPDGSLETKRRRRKRFISMYFVACIFFYFCDPRREDHVADPSMRELRDVRVLGYELEIVPERALPGEPFALATMRLQQVANIQLVFAHFTTSESDGSDRRLEGASPSESLRTAIHANTLQTSKTLPRYRSTRSLPFANSFAMVRTTLSLCPSGLTVG